MERLDELLGKAKAGVLSADERQELARLLNAPVMPAPTEELEGFVSQRELVKTDLAARVRQVDWFARCGQGFALSLSMPVEPVASWKEAMKHARGEAWGHAILEARNQLTMWLHLHDHANYQRWNEIVRRHKAELLTPLAAERWAPFQKAQDLPDKLLHTTSWCVLGALMENSYLGNGHRCGFFLELLDVFEAGHFACGWRGEWPTGVLLVY